MGSYLLLCGLDHGECFAVKWVGSWGVFYCEVVWIIGSYLLKCGLDHGECFAVK